VGKDQARTGYTHSSGKGLKIDAHQQKLLSKGTPMRQLIKDGIAYSWFYTLLHRPLGPLAGVPVFTYHRIGDGGDPFFPALSTPLFEQQIHYLAATYRIITLDDMILNLASGILPQRAAVLTFDDGYYDTFSAAWPILKRYHVTATTFIATGCIGTGAPLWTDTLAQIFKRTIAKTVSLPLASVEQQFPLESTDQRLSALQLTKAWLKQLPTSDRQRHLRELKHHLRDDDRRGLERHMLDWEEIRQLSREGMQFGAHTVNHPVLSRLPEGEAFQEIQQSKSDLEEQLQREVTTFAYPNGTADDFDHRTEELVRKIGFRGACSTLAGLSRPGSDLFAIPRLYTTDRSLPRFAWRVTHTAD
jgi:peptidoglycan/xylan/chitin deacetylase (PgdA/CDA1 family)